MGKKTGAGYARKESLSNTTTRVCCKCATNTTFQWYRADTDEQFQCMRCYKQSRKERIKQQKLAGQENGHSSGGEDAPVGVAAGREPREHRETREHKEMREQMQIRPERTKRLVAISKEVRRVPMQMFETVELDDELRFNIACMFCGSRESSQWYKCKDLGAGCVCARCLPNHQQRDDDTSSSSSDSDVERRSKYAHNRYSPAPLSQVEMGSKTGPCRRDFILAAVASELAEQEEMDQEGMFDSHQISKLTRPASQVSLPRLKSEALLDALSIPRQ